ncbi:MAG: CoB--CoM heterodisulfide reductase iron-sulfur subunit A family protein [Desulfurococcaceae archaeon]|uniref:CoB--CoM heterodisulfide reductase iron-sulfur subunit A n=1 Tax=Staphylothermus marinus TaxID=2280 RepID=A0A7C4NRQ6_STAMA
MARIGVFVCHCGRNIAGTVDVKEVVNKVSKLPGVVHVEDYVYMCSEPGQQRIIDAIKSKNLDAVVVAACTPSLHYETFAKAVESAGLNRYRLEMACIREFCSWVHFDRKAATDKAIRIIASTVAKVHDNKSYERITGRVVKKALVIGGGIAGISAALTLANAGIETILVEKTPTIGGKMAMLSETFPTLDCAQCILTPKMAEVAHNPNIKLYTLSEVVDVNGYLGNFHVRIRKKPRKVNIDLCRLCGFCERVCPVEVPNEYNLGLNKRKAIYIPFPQAVPSAYVVDSENCNRCGRCLKVCPTKAINLDEEEVIIEENVGAIIVATGYEQYPAEKLVEFGYGRDPDIITSLHFERILSPSGPTGGKIVRVSDGKPVKRVVFIQCAGSRDENHLPYCSKICCMFTAKHTLLFKERVPDGEATVFYIDIRAGGKGYEEFVKRVQGEFKINYIRGRVSRIYRDSEGNIVVSGIDTLSNERVVVKADLVVLALGMVSTLTSELASKLKLPIDSYGFVQEAHPKLKPVEVSTAGVYVCGAVQGPKDISESVTQALASASKVIELLSREVLVREPIIAEVDRELCNGCRICLTVCPYSAIEIVEGKARVNEMLCEGCGSCDASCPTGAIKLRNYGEEQLIKSMKAAIEV